MGKRPALNVAGHGGPNIETRQDSPGCQLDLPLFAPELAGHSAAEVTDDEDEPGQRTATEHEKVVEQRSAHDRMLIARIAAAERWARTPDRSAATAPARRGLQARFEREADPDGVLPPDERTRGADLLMRAHMLRMARRSAQVRRPPS